MSRPPPDTPNRRALDPRKGNITCDANVFYWDGTARDHLVDRFCRLRAEGVLSVVIAGEVRPTTPDDIKAAIQAQIFHLRPDLNVDQKVQRRRVKEILTDNAIPGKHDAVHHTSPTLPKQGACTSSLRISAFSTNVVN